MKPTVFSLAFPALFAAAALGAEIRVDSPNGAASIAFDIRPDAPLAYSVTFHGHPVIAPSPLGYEIDGQPSLNANFRLLSSKAGEIDETYPLIAGKANPVRDHCRTLTIELAEVAPPLRRLDLEARAFDDGIAFRYLLPNQPVLREVRITAEDTGFDFAKEGTIYPLILRDYHTPYEDDYHVLPLAGLHGSDLIGLPFLAELPGVAWVAITEADIDNYAGMYLVPSPRKHEGRRLLTRLAPSMFEPGLAVDAATPIVSPWRVILLGDEPGRLVESNIVTSLNPPCAIADTSWIKPGKTAWDWWSGDYDQGVDFKPGMNTATMEHYIDFAAASGFPYMLIDAGWAAGGKGPNFSDSDLTRFNPEVDLPGIIAHARSKGVRIWLWANWLDINRQCDLCFPLFEKWGIAGVKIDFMERDDQWMVNFYRRIVRKAAEHRLMIDYHGAFKPDGLRRTWPNLLTREGVMGAEYNKWSARITPEHNLMLAFTRMLAGPMDYTPGGFDNVTRAEFEPRWVRPEVMTTRAHALALYAILESPLQMVSDDPEAYRDQPGFDFIQAVPTTWNETRVLGGDPDHSIAIARRSGREWYVGVITGRDARTVEIPLDILGPGEFFARIYSDAPDSDRLPRHLAVENRRVGASTRLLVRMAPGGGEAIRITP